MDITEYRFTKEHEWICVEPDDTGRVGLSYYAQVHLGDLVFLDLPEVGSKVEQFGKLGELESVKAVSDVFSPASGVVLETNHNAVDEPGLVNKDPYGGGWLAMIKLSNPSELDNLMNKSEYNEFMKQCEESGQ